MHYIQPFFFFICQNLFKESMYCQLVFCSLNWDGRYTLLLLFASFSFYPVYIYHHCFTTLGNTLKSKTIFVQYIFLTINASNMFSVILRFVMSSYSTCVFNYCGDVLFKNWFCVVFLWNFINCQVSVDYQIYTPFIIINITKK